MLPVVFGAAAALSLVALSKGQRGASSGVASAGTLGGGRIVELFGAVEPQRGGTDAEALAYAWRTWTEGLRAKGWTLSSLPEDLQVAIDFRLEHGEPPPGWVLARNVPKVRPSMFRDIQWFFENDGRVADLDSGVDAMTQYVTNAIDKIELEKWANGKGLHLEREYDYDSEEDLEPEERAAVDDLFHMYLFDGYNIVGEGRYGVELPFGEESETQRLIYNELAAEVFEELEREPLEEWLVQRRAGAPTFTFALRIDNPKEPSYGPVVDTLRQGLEELGEGTAAGDEGVNRVAKAIQSGGARWTEVLGYADRVFETHGVESMEVDDEDYASDSFVHYLNSGDSYSPTLAYFAEKDEWQVTTYADLREELEALKKEQVDDDEEDEEYGVSLPTDQVPGSYMVLLDWLEERYPSSVEDWRPPKGLSLYGYEAAEAILREMIRIEESGKDFGLYAGQVVFRTPAAFEEITNYPPMHSELGIVYDGGNHAKWFRSRWDVLKKVLEPLGMYFEEVNHWSGIVVRIPRTIRTSRTATMLLPTAHPRIGDTLEADAPHSVPGLGMLDRGAVGWIQDSGIYPPTEHNPNERQPWWAIVYFPGLGHWRIDMNMWDDWARFFTFYPGRAGVPIPETP